MVEPKKELLVFVSGDCWKTQAEAAYGRQTTPPESIAKFGNCIHDENIGFIKGLAALMREPKDSIPPSILALMSSTIHYRDNIRQTAAREVSPEMGSAFRTALSAARSYFDNDVVQSPNNALSAIQTYTQKFEKRSAAAQAHVASAPVQLSGSPAQVVAWCRTLAGYSRQEVGDSMAIASTSINQPHAMPGIEAATGALRMDALKVIQATNNHLINGMPTAQKSDPADRTPGIKASYSPAKQIMQAADAFTQTHGHGIALPANDQSPQPAAPRQIAAPGGPR